MPHTSPIVASTRLFLTLLLAFPAPAFAAASAADPFPTDARGGPGASVEGGPALQQEDLVLRALKRVPAITSAQRTVEAGHKRVEAARDAYYPSVSVSGSVTLSNSLTPSTGVTAPTDIEAATAGLHQEIYNFGRTASLVDSAQATLDVNRGTLQDQVVEVAHQVRTAYINWIEARGLEQQAQAQVLSDQRLFDQTNAFFKAGTRARLDVTTARATLEQERAIMLAARTTTQQAREALAISIGDRRPLEGTPVFPAVPAIAKRPLDQLEALALNNHPLLASARARVALARASRESAEAANKPDFGADASYGARARELDPAPSWNLDASVSWPIFNWGGYERQVEAAKLSEAATVADEETQSNSLILGVVNAYLAIEGASARLPATNVELASAKENLFQAEGRYKAGVGSIIEVSTAQALIATAESDQLKAQAQYHSAIADLLAAVGQTGTEP